ncbi:hypothetical protein AFLA70_397g001171 [Aspergillus flavus AF70]|nr:hypothetical protein AFLA70_397g001171 [Aspergillus flavus AF70]
MAGNNLYIFMVGLRLAFELFNKVEEGFWETASGRVILANDTFDNRRNIQTLQHPLEALGVLSCIESMILVVSDE